MTITTALAFQTEETLVDHLARLADEIANARWFMDRGVSALATREQPVALAAGRRAAPRFPLTVAVDFTSEHNFYTGFTENVGAGGLFIATHLTARLGDELEVAFTVPGLQGCCVARCRVRWLREHNPSTPDIPPGMGCEFSDIGAEAIRAIERFTARRGTIFFD